MGKGGYAGGSTIIGPRRRWSDWREFPEPAHPSSLPPELLDEERTAIRRAKRAAKPSPADAVIDASPAWLSQEAVLAALGLHRLPPKAKDRGPILKGLVRSGVLLPTGRPNPEHSFIRAMIARKEKTDRG